MFGDCRVCRPRYEEKPPQRSAPPPTYQRCRLVARGAESQKQKKGTSVRNLLFYILKERNFWIILKSLGKPSIVKKRCFVKSLNKMSPFYEVPIYFFRPFFERKKEIILKVV